MRVSVMLRNVNKNNNLTHLKNIIDTTLAECPKYMQKLKQEQQAIVFGKMKHLNKWYTKIIGLDEVKVYQERVTALQDQLLNTQNKRREIVRQLTEIRQQAHEIQSQIQHIDRKEKFDVYCELIKDERQILNMEKSISATFQEYDQAERDLFTAFTNAVRDSQEKQRSQLEYSKYISLVLSIIGSFLAFTYTVFWKNDLKMYIKQEFMAKEDLENLQQFMGTFKSEQTNIINDIKNKLVAALDKYSVIEEQVEEINQKQIENQTNLQQFIGNFKSEQTNIINDIKNKVMTAVNKYSVIERQVEKINQKQIENHPNFETPNPPNKKSISSVLLGSVLFVCLMLCKCIC